MSEQDRRDSERINVEAVEVMVKSTGLFGKVLEQHAEVLDVSYSGLGLRSHTPFEEGKSYRFGFELKWLNSTSYVTGKIAYCRQEETEAGTEAFYRIGVRVMQDPDATMSFIRTAMEERAHQIKLQQAAGYDGNAASDTPDQ